MAAKRPADPTPAADLQKKPKVKSKAPVSLSLGKSVTSSEVVTLSQPPASAFEASSSSDEEEMPPEAKMRMKNIGKATKTSAGGPNSFGKQPGVGFQDPRNKNERIIKQLATQLDREQGGQR